jgi:hypothetical protein
LPAWQKTGALEWGRFSRHADLERGLFFYPAEAFSGAIFSGLAALSVRGDRSTPDAAKLPIYLAALLSLAGLLLTTRAAPNMLRVRHLDDDAAGLQQALDGFEFWSRLRAVAQTGAFVANVFSLARLP